MSPFNRDLLIGSVALAASMQAAAQPPHPDPTPAEPAAYTSAFSGYKPFQAVELQDWRKANETVRDIGGWRAYAREIQANNTPGAAPGARATPPTQQLPSTTGAGTRTPDVQPKVADPHAGHGR